ncbi:MAG TPA: hypothetical protein VEO74_02710 [Thermoanaerobaculia bacterium]|nr:hypothetical protein [Thermoanaerobaculia bacterium]
MKPLLLLFSLLFGEERVLTTPTIGLYSGNGSASVAASRTNYLAAWFEQSRSGSGTPGRIGIMPFTESGTAAQTTILLDETFGPPGAGSNGDDYLLAWCVDGAITVRPIGTDGVPLGEARALTPSLSQGYRPEGGATRVLWNGSHYVVAAAADVAFGNFDNVHPSTEVAIVGTDARLKFDDQTLADAAAMPGLTLLLTTSPYYPGLYGRFIDDTGRASAPFEIAERATAAAVASDGASFLVAWISDGRELRVARIALGGTVSPPVTIAGETWLKPALAWNGREFCLSWVDRQATKYAIVTESGALKVQSVGPLFAEHLDLAGRDGASALVLEDSIVVGRVFRGETVTGVDLAKDVLYQFHPRLAGDSLYYLEEGVLIRQSPAGREFVIKAAAYDVDESAVAWNDGGGHAGIILQVGNDKVERSFSIDQFPIEIVMASNGDTHLLVYLLRNAVYCTRVAADGTLLDPGGIQLSLRKSGFSPQALHAVWRGDDFLVQWQEGPIVKSALVGQQREVIDFTMPYHSLVHSIAASGGKTVAAWFDSAGKQIHLGRVDPEAPSAGPIVATTKFLAYDIRAFPTNDGVEVVWHSADDIDIPIEVTWATPRLILYSKLLSKGTVIAARTVATARRRAAAAP